MNIVLKENNKILAIASCIAQESKNADFIPMAVAITNSDLILFNDHTPDEIKDDTYSYLPKVRIPLTSIACLIKEKIVKDKKLYSYLRINVILRNAEDSFFIYYYCDDEKRIKKFLKVVRKQRVKIKKRKADISPVL